MATSSITRSFVIDNEEQAERFINALEASKQEAPIKYKHTPNDELLAFMSRIKKGIKMTYLEKLRRDNNLDLHTLAFVLHMSTQEYVECEQGNVIPTDVIAVLADIYQISCEELLNGQIGSLKK